MVAHVRQAMRNARVADEEIDAFSREALEEHSPEDTEELQKTLFEEIKGRIKQDDSSVPYQDRNYNYYTRYREGQSYPLYCRRVIDGSEKEQIMLDVLAYGCLDEFGIAPRIGRGLLREVGSARRVRDLAAEFADHGLIPYSINAFPIEDFHAPRVKEQVYAPPWTRRERATLLDIGNPVPQFPLLGAHRRVGGCPGN